MKHTGCRKAASANHLNTHTAHCHNGQTTHLANILNDELPCLQILAGEQPKTLSPCAPLHHHSQPV